MTTLTSWEFDGVQVWEAPILRRPHVVLSENDGPLLVVEVADYEDVSRLLGEAVALLERCDALPHFSSTLDTDIERFLAAASK